MIRVIVLLLAAVTSIAIILLSAMVDRDKGGWPTLTIGLSVVMVAGWMTTYNDLVAGA